MDRTERVATSLTPENKQRLRRLSAEEGMTMSQYVRKVLLEKMDQAEVEGNPTPALVAN